MNKYLQICLVFGLLAFTINAQNLSTLTKAKDFGMGLSIGMGALAHMPDAFNCVNEAGPLVSDIENVIEEIKNHPSDIFGIIKKVENITKEITSVLPTCKSLSAEGKEFFADVAHHFTNSTLRNQGLLNLFKNFEEVKQDIEDGVAYLKNGTQETDFIVAGSKFGSVINIFCNGGQQSASAEVAFFELASNSTLVSKIEHVLLGFVFGSQSLSHLPDALECVNNAMSLKTEVEKLIADIKDKSIIDAIKIVSELAKQLKPELAACENLKQELVVYGEDLEQLFSNQTRQVQGLQNLVKNFEEVAKGIETVVSSVKAGEDTDLQNAGFALGNIFRIFAYGEQTTQFQVAAPCKPGCLTLPNGSCDCIDGAKKFLN